MHIIDLTHTIKPDMPVFPGSEKPLFQQVSTVPENGYAETKITINSHTGTHIDAPAHILKDYSELDHLPVDQFFGKALCINIASTNRVKIEKEILKRYHNELCEIDFVLFFTGWNKYWEISQYYSGYPVLSKEAAELLCTYKLKGVGFDTISADKSGSLKLPIHRILLQHMIIIENLTNLEQVTTQQFLFSCLPWKIIHGDGSPVRAVAILN